MTIHLMTLRAVIARTSLSRTTLYRLQASGAFPHSIPVSIGRVAWIESVVDESIVREIIPQLKKVGAEGIIELPINKIIQKT